jgi:hypothetical protein
MESLNGKGKMIFGGLALAGFAGYFLLKDKYFKKPYPPELVVKVLKRLRSELFPVFWDLFKQALQITKNLQDRHVVISPRHLQDLEELLLNKNDNFDTVVQRIEQKVYSKFGISDPDLFRQNCELTYKDHPEIALLMTTMKEQKSRVVRLQAPLNFATVPDNVSKKNMIEIHKRLSIATAEKLVTVVEELLNQGEVVSMVNPVCQKLLDQYMIGFQEEKTLILAEYGIVDGDDSPFCVFVKLQEKFFAMADSNYFSKTQEIEKKIKTLSNRLLTQPISKNEIAAIRLQIKQQKKSLRKGMHQKEATEGGKSWKSKLGGKDKQAGVLSEVMEENYEEEADLDDHMQSPQNKPVEGEEQKGTSGSDDDDLKDQDTSAEHRI